MEKRGRMARPEVTACCISHDKTLLAFDMGADVPRRFRAKSRHGGDAAVWLCAADEQIYKRVQA